MESVEERFDSIEDILKQLSLAQLNTEKELTSLKQNLEKSGNRLEKFLEETNKRMEKGQASLHKEMIEFKDEMRLSNKEFRDEMRLSNKEFKDEMRLSNKEFKEEMKAITKDLNKKWGDLANRMGTVVEDIIRPNIPIISKKYFNCDPHTILIRAYRKNKDNSTSKEFDIIAVCDTFVILNETKTTATKEYINDFVKILDDKIFYKFYPEYKHLKVIPIFSAINMNEKLINLLTDNNIFAMVPSGNTMDLVNYEKLNKEFI